MRLLLVLVLFSVPFQLFTQNACDWADLASISYRTSPLNADLNESARVSFDTYALDLKVPFTVGSNKRVIVGLDAANNGIHNHLTADHWSFSHLGMRIIYQTGTENSKFEFMFMPKLSSTFTGGIDRKDIQFGGAFFRTQVKGNKFRLRYGVYYNQELFGPMIIPMIGFDWLMAAKWRLKVLVPLNLELAYTSAKFHRFGLLFIGANASYRMRGQLNPFTLYPSNYQPYLDKADNNVWLFSDVFVTSSLVLNFRAGYSVLRKYRFYDEGDKMNLKLGPVNIGDDRANSPALMKNGLSFEIRLLYRVQIKNPSVTNPEGKFTDGSQNSFL